MTDVTMADKRMKLRYAGVCRLCGAELPARVEAIYERSTRTVRCLSCEFTKPDLETEQPEAPGMVRKPGSGVAGASARREYERRRARDEERLRQKWGWFGGIAVALADEKQSTKAWEIGAVGEERLGARLDSLASDSIAVLHDRRIPGSRANIDHLVVTPGGVWVIDAKRYQGRPQLRVEGGVFRPRAEKLFVGQRDRTSLVDGVIKQIEIVKGLLGDVPVTGALCFVGAEWPLIGGAFTTRGVYALWPKCLGKLLVESSGSVDVAAVRTILIEQLRSA